MMELGWLAPDGTMIECQLMEHIYVAEEIAERLGWKEIDIDGNRVYADQFLMNHGFVHITRSLLFGHDYHIFHDKHFTQAQKDWLRPRIEENLEYISKGSLISWQWENNEECKEED